MATYNDITGDPMRSKAATNTYRDNYDAIFGKKEQKVQVTQNETVQPEQVPDQDVGGKQ